MLRVPALRVRESQPTLLMLLQGQAEGVVHGESLKGRVILTSEPRTQRSGPRHQTQPGPDYWPELRPVHALGPIDLLRQRQVRLASSLPQPEYGQPGTIPVVERDKPLLRWHHFVVGWFAPGRGLGLG
jgi:hypothetical protein